MGRTGEGGWEVLGTAPLDAGFSQRIDALRVEALVRGRGPVPVDLWLPPDQILVRNLPPGGPQRTEVLRHLPADSGYRAHELCVAVSPRQMGQSPCAMAVPASIVAEAREYAERWGFMPGRVTTRPDAAAFGQAWPSFEPPPRFARARRAARNAGIAAAATVLIGVAAWGGWQMRPGAGSDIVSGAAPVLMLATVDDAAPDVRRPPFTRVRRDGVQALTSFRPQTAGPAPAGSVKMPTVSPLPALAHTSPGVPKGVGPAPALPGQFRPARLDRPVAATDLPDPAALVGSMDRLRNEVPPRAASQQPEPLPVSAVTALTAMPIEHAALRDETGAPLIPATPMAVVQFAAATMAPRSVPDLPTPRPEIGSVADAVTEATETAPSPSAAGSSPAAPPPRPGSAAAAEPDIDVAAPGPSAAVSPLAVTAAPRPPAKPEEAARLIALPEGHHAVVGDPSPAGVGRSAVRTGLELDSTSLIGVLDAKSGRQALLRTPAGQFLKVARGDTVDGWRVSAINRDAVRLTRGGQNRTLLLVVR